MAKSTHRNQLNAPDETPWSTESFTLESAYGSVKPSNKPEDFEEISRIAKDEKVERFLRKLMEE